MLSVGVGRLALAGLLMAAPVPAAGQENLNQGKTPQQIFNTDCAVCHRSVRGLGAAIGPLGLSGFLTGHYTTSAAAANAMARYLTEAGTGGRDAQPQRRRPRAAKPATSGQPKNN
jgi:mono/diheme cytochrome c family protein